MAGINPISGGLPPFQPAFGEAHGASKAQAAKSFSRTLTDYVSTVEKDQQLSASAVEDLLSGRIQDPLPVVTAMAKADLSFKLLMGVRNKVIDAYKQTMSMQI